MCYQAILSAISTSQKGKKNYRNGSFKTMIKLIFEIFMVEFASKILMGILITSIKIKEQKEFKFKKKY